MEKMIYLDGKMVPQNEAKISVFDHGVLYGDGVFEGIRAYNKRVFKLDEHIDRIYDSAKIIMLNIPLSKAEFKKAIIETCKANGIVNGYIRPVVTRGPGGLGLAPWICEKPTIFIIADVIKLYPDEYYQNGLPMCTVPTRRNLPESLSPMVKSLNYLNNIMAKIEARNAGMEEAIMMNQEGYVAECTGDNIFVIRKDKVYTPPIYAGALMGITRAVVIELLAKMGYDVIETNLTRADLYLGDEMFLTGTAAEVVPVISLDARIIGTGIPGELTKKLITAYKAYTNSNGTPIE